MRILIGLALATVVSTSALAADRQPWYEAHPASVKTLKQALAEEREFLRFHLVSDNKWVAWPNGNPYWRGHSADANTCAALKDVGLTCDYNTRSTLTDFLTVNGKSLFPASGGTNPYYTAADRAQDIKMHAEHGYWVPIDNGFIGHGRQNAMLAAAVRRNANLFKDGDLSAADVKKRWR